MIKFFYEFTEKLLLENKYFFYQNAHLFQLIVLNSNDTLRGRRVTNFSPFYYNRFNGNLL